MVGQGTIGSASAFSGPRRIPYDIVVDPTRDAFCAYGLARGSLVQVGGPKVVGAWREAVAGGATQGGFNGGSYFQLGGTFVVGQDGILRFVHRDRDATDDPETDDVLAAARWID